MFDPGASMEKLNGAGAMELQELGPRIDADISLKKNRIRPSRGFFPGLLRVHKSNELSKGSGSRVS